MGKGNMMEQGHVKRALVNEQLKILGAKLLDARSIVDWCSSELSQVGLLIQ